MFFSVIIPVYNVEKFIEQSVNSVLNQEEKDLEIILVDDGSTDSSGKICDAFAEKYPDIIRVIHKENEGLLLTRRCGIRAAKGDYFVHLDSDDYMMPGALASIRKTILKYDADMVICKVAYGAADGKSIDYYSKLPFENGQIFEGEGKEQLYRQLLCEGFLNAVYQKITKRGIVDIDTDYSKWKRVSLAEDLLQSLPLADKSKKAVFSDCVIVYYRYNEASITKKKSISGYINNIWSYIDVFGEEMNYFGKWNLSDEMIAGTAAKNSRRLCVQIRKLVAQTEKSSKKEVKRFLAELKADETWKKTYELADKRRMGRFSKWCGFFIKTGNYAMLRLLCRHF